MPFLACRLLIWLVPPISDLPFEREAEVVGQLLSSHEDVQALQLYHYTAELTYLCLPRIYLEMLNLAVLSGKASMGLLIVCHALAMCTTTFRLYHRLRDRRLWWDDFWAAVAVTGDIVVFVVYLIIFYGTVQNPPKPAYLTFGLRWLTLICFSIALWAARLTVSVTIVRILADGPGRRNAQWASVAFGIFATIMVIQKIVTCNEKEGLAQRCLTEPKYTGIMELITNFLGDLWLLVAPAYMLWNMRLQQSHRKLLLFIFLCGIFTALASIVHAMFIFMSSYQWVGVISHVELAIAVIVSNLLVLITYIYRLFKNISENNSDSTSAQTSEPVTTDRSSESTSPSDQSNGSDVASSSRIRTTTIELTELSNLDTIPDTPTFSENTQSYNTTNSTHGATPFSSFSYSIDSRESQSGDHSSN